MAKDDVGRIYLIHLDRPLGNDGNFGRSKAQHYTGWATNVRRRVVDHLNGRPGKEHNGSKLLAHANAAAIGWRVVAIRPGTFEDEKRTKFNGGAWRRCPVCNPKIASGEETPIMRAHESAGNVGISSAKMFRFHCGGCNAVTETFAANLDEAKSEAHEQGWTNGHRRDLSINGAGYTTESTWRCGLCSGGAPAAAPGPGRVQVWTGAEADYDYYESGDYARDREEAEAAREDARRELERDAESDADEHARREMEAEAADREEADAFDEIPF